MSDRAFRQVIPTRWSIQTWINDEFDWAEEYDKEEEARKAYARYTRSLVDKPYAWPNTLGEVQIRLCRVHSTIIELCQGGPAHNAT